MQKLENPKESMKTTTANNNTQKSIVFLYTFNKWYKIKITQFHSQ